MSTGWPNPLRRARTLSDGLVSGQRFVQDFSDPGGRSWLERAISRWKAIEGMRVDPDDDAVRWAMNGDRAEFAGLVHEHGQAVYAYLARRAGRQVADDLLTDVWLRAWRSRRSYNPQWPSPRPWLYGIARNSLRAHWRLLADQPRPPLEADSNPWPDIDDRLEAARLRPALEAALERLGDENREVLLLVAWEQLTPAEVAIALDVPPSTVRSRLHRARSIVQQQLDSCRSCMPPSDYTEARP